MWGAPNLKYVVARSEKTYLAVSEEVYQKVKAYAQEKGLKLIEASWRLLAIGFQYDIGGAPRINPLFATSEKIYRTITDKVRKRKVNIADEYLVDPETWAIDRVDEISNPRHQRIVRQQRGGLLSEINKLNRQKKNREELLVGAYKLIEALRAENALLKQKLKLQDRWHCLLRFGLLRWFVHSSGGIDILRRDIPQFFQVSTLPPLYNG